MGCPASARKVAATILLHIVRGAKLAKRSVLVCVNDGNASASGPRAKSWKQPKVEGRDVKESAAPQTTGAHDGPSGKTFGT